MPDLCSNPLGITNYCAMSAGNQSLSLTTQAGSEESDRPRTTRMNCAPSTPLLLGLRCGGIRLFGRVESVHAVLSPSFDLLFPLPVPKAALAAARISAAPPRRFLSSVLAMEGKNRNTFDGRPPRLCPPIEVADAEDVPASPQVVAGVLRRAFAHRVDLG